MTIKAQDIMVTEVISVGPNAELLDAYWALVDNRITGAPVVDGKGKVIGVISMSDFMDAVNEHSEGMRPSCIDEYYDERFSQEVSRGLAFSDAVNEKLEELSVSDAMTEAVISVSPNDSIATVASTMHKNHIHRVLVVDSGTLVGLISSMDLVKLLEKIDKKNTIKL